LHPAKVLILGFLAITIIGSLILSLPISWENGAQVKLTDAVFTATSAVCVTGLSVMDTEKTFSLFGEIVILILIQTGGLGFMTFAVWFAILAGKKIGLKQRLLIQESTRNFSLQGIVKLAKQIIYITLIVELISTLLLAIRFVPQLGGLKGAYYALFHTISGFNNAGFSLFYDNLSSYVSDPIINLVIMLDIIIGGLGFMVIIDVVNKKHSFHKYNLHSKLVIITTLILIFGGAFIIYFFEWNNAETIQNMNLPTQVLAVLFQSVTTRTAGFNTINIGAMTHASLFFMIILMFIGASPGSTGGGIKTSTIALIFASVRSTIKGENDAVLFERRIDEKMVKEALAVFVIHFLLVSTFAMVLTVTDNDKDFISLLFETVSALGTVGLSTGITGALSTLGKWTIIIAMLFGRLGPLTIAFALANKRVKIQYKYPEEKVIIG